MSSGSGQLVVISNGEEFFEIPLEDLADARSDGFYLPHEKGNTVVSNGEETFEIPLDVLAEAEADGYQNVIPEPPAVEAGRSSEPSPRRQKRKRPRSKSARPLIKGLPKPALVRAGAVQIEGAAAVDQLDLDAFQIESEFAQAQLEKNAVAIDTGEEEPEAVFAESIALEEEVVDEDEQRRMEIAAELEETEDFWPRFKLLVALYRPTQREILEFGRTYGLSIGLHIVAAIILGFMVYSSSKPKQDGGAVIASTLGDDELVEEAEEIPQEVKIEETDTQTETSDAADPAGAISQDIGAATDLAAFAGVEVGGGLEGLSEALGKGVDQMTGEGEKASASFFGSKQLASRFVFVIDNSLSMTRGRFETALNELAKTVMALKPQQSFYIIFYSDTAYGLFHPQTYDDLIPATPRNKQLTIQWLMTVELCLRTDFADALRMAFSLNPDVIFVLGDGGFTDTPKVNSVMAARDEETKKITIHTLGMELDKRGVSNFQSLSNPTGGTYRDVGVHPLGAEMARRNPRKRNSSRGPIWGIRLK